MNVNVKLMVVRQTYFVGCQFCQRKRALVFGSGKKYWLLPNEKDIGIVQKKTGLLVVRGNTQCCLLEKKVFVTVRRKGICLLSEEKSDW